jgi:hypothetical protein
MQSLKTLSEDTGFAQMFYINQEFDVSSMYLIKTTHGQP